MVAKYTQLFYFDGLAVLDRSLSELTISALNRVDSGKGSAYVKIHVVE